MSRPIPRRLLPHTITWLKKTGADRYSKPTYAEGVTIKYVRYENIKKNLLNSQGESKDDKGVLFIDMRNTSPRVEFSKEDKITFGSNEYTIREIGELFGDSPEVHHLEINLV